MIYSTAIEIVSIIIKEKLRTLIIYYSERMSHILESKFFGRDLDCLVQAYDCIMTNKPIENLGSHNRNNGVNIIGNSDVKESGNKYLSIDGDFIGNGRYEIGLEKDKSSSLMDLAKRFTFEGDSQDFVRNDGKSYRDGDKKIKGDNKTGFVSNQNSNNNHNYNNKKDKEKNWYNSLNSQKERDRDRDPKKHKNWFNDNKH